MKAPEKTKTILECLKKYFCSPDAMHQKICFTELRVGAGFTEGNGRTIDFYTLEIAPSRGHESIAYEIKVSRGDFLKDIKSPAKQRGIRNFSDKFYYVAPKGLLKPDEIPTWAGLIEITDDFKNLEWTLHAPKLDKLPPSWSFLVSAVRNKSR